MIPASRLAAVVILTPFAHLHAAGPQLELIDVKRIWDRAPHCAFTDLLHDGKEWFCTFREGASHVSPDGAIRVLVSPDATTWTSAARITSTTADLRDPKLSRSPDGRLVLVVGAALHRPARHTHESFVWTSKDGREWNGPIRVVGDDQWLWRLTWHGKEAFGVSYSTNTKPAAILHRGDEKSLNPVGGPFRIPGEANETALVFEPDGAALCLIRRDREPGSGLLGRAIPPYTDWTWREVGARIGGPQMLRLPDGQLIAAVRLYDGKQRTSVCWIDTATGKLTESLALPSGGDTSYAGMVWHDGLLYVSYYSSHEGKTAIYLARVRVPK